MLCPSSFLKLYTTTSISKLASFLELDEYTLRTTLLTLKQRARQPTTTPGRKVLDFEWVSAVDIDFYIDGVSRPPTRGSCSSSRF
jgi:translation initiation factor 3 subunit L